LSSSSAAWTECTSSVKRLIVLGASLRSCKSFRSSLVPRYSVQQYLQDFRKINHKKRVSSIMRVDSSVEIRRRRILLLLHGKYHSIISVKSDYQLLICCYLWAFLTGKELPRLYFEVEASRKTRGKIRCRALITVTTIKMIHQSLA
jgi:hypothetical protein